MDPLNNPTPTPTPNPTPTPTPNPEPANPTMPPLEPASTTPTEQSLPPTPGPASMFKSASTMEPTNTVGEATPVNPFRSEASEVKATDPIIMAEAPKEPDPAEQELNAPMVAAGPAPGSIGSAISGPAAPLSELEEDAMPVADNPFRNAPSQPAAQNVAFNDPAAEPQAPAPQAVGGGKAPSKMAALFKEKKTMVILIAVAAVVVVVLLVVLIVMMTSGGNSSNPPVNNGGGSSQGGTGDNGGGASEDEELSGIVSCQMTMNMSFGDGTGVSTTTTDNVDFNIEDGEIVNVTTTEVVTNADGTSSSQTTTEPFSAEESMYTEGIGLPYDVNGVLTVESLDEFASDFEVAFTEQAMGLMTITCTAE